MGIDRDGQTPDGYIGLNPVKNPPVIRAQRAPTTGDRRYKIGSVWINTSANTAYFLTSVVAGSATWALASPGASDVDTLTGDGGGAISPAAGNINLSGGTNITTSGAGSTITFNLDAAIVLATSVSSPLYTVAAGNDLLITSAAGQDVVIKMGDAAGANKVSFTDSADVEVASIDSNGAFSMGAITFTGLLTASASATIETAGTALNLGSDNSGDAVNLGVGTVARAINIGTSAAAHVVSIGNAAAGAITLDSAAGISLDGAAASNFSVSGAGIDLSLISTGGRVVVNGEEAAADAIRLLSAAGGLDADVALQLSLVSSQAAAADSVRIQASAADGGIDIDSGTGGITIDSTDLISIDAAAASNFSVSGAGIDLTLASAAGRVVMNGEEAAADALRLNSAAGGLDCDVALQLSLVSSQAAVADAVRIQASAADGGIDIDSGTGGINMASTGVMDLDAAGALSINSSAGVINVGNDAVAQNINIGTGGDRTITIGNAGGANSLVLVGGTSDITVTGTVKEIDAEFLFSSGTDLTITQSPIMQSNANTGAAPTGGAGDVNLMYLQDGCLMEQYCITAQTIIAPRMDATAGLSIGLDLVDDNGAEYNFGARNNAKHAYTIGTSAAFFIEAQIYVADLSGCEPLLLGFRKVQANNADYTLYTDFYGIGLNNATSATAVTLASQLNSGGVTLQSSGDAWGGDGTTQTLKVLVSATGVVTATISGVAPSAPLAYTFDNADVVMPYLHFLHDTTTPGVIGLKSLKCGFQA